MKEFAFDLQRFANESTLTVDEKAAIQKSSLPHLRMISNIAKNPLVTGLVSTLENFKDGVGNISKDILPIYELVASFYKITRGNSGTAIKKKGDQDKVLRLLEDVEILKSSVEIIDPILDLVDGLSGVDTQKMIKEPDEIIREALSISNTVAKLKDASSDTIVLSLITTTLSYGLSVVSTLDGVTADEQKEIRKAALRLGVESITSSLEEMGHNLDNYTAPFGWVSAGISVGLAIIEGIYQYNDRIDYYSDDGLPEDIVRKEALIDAISGGLHEGLSNYLMGADDAIFNISKFLSEGCNWLAHALSGTLDNYQFTVSEMNYVEFIREIAKSGEYHSTSDADAITVSGNGISIYAQDGNDYIENYYSNVTILAGHGDDMISSYGGADNDNIIAYGEGNSISGGAGDDMFDLTESTKTVIEYTAGEGTDVIYGYDASDLIKIKGSYSTQVSGEDILIAVANGGIIVKDAKDLKLNINTIEPAEEESLDNDTQGGFTPVNSGIVFMPTFRDLGNAIRGTNGNDRIENTLSNVMIYGFDGNDTIINYGNNVTINAGNGNDSVVNYGASVKVNGGAGNDYIYSEGKATINGGDGKDTVDNTGNNSIIDGGDGMDSIKNSGENTDINSGAGVDRIVNLASVVEIYSYLDDNYITNTKSNVTIEGSEDNDYIFNSGNSVSINAGAGNNSISIDGAAGGYQTVEAGNGNDTVQVGDRDE